MNVERKIRKTEYSCLESHPRGFENPIRKFKRIKRNFDHMYQRIKYGYCDRDVWSIDWWFLSLMPNMLEDLRTTANGYPSVFENDNVKRLTIDESEETDEGIKKWDEILCEMAFLLNEAHEIHCKMENPYDDEYEKASKEFSEKYGYFGEKLRTLEEIEEDKKTGSRHTHLMSDHPEYQEISDKYFEEERKIREYRESCKDKGLQMFSEWFWNLWD